MKSLSVRLKITLWFSAILVIVVLITVAAILTVSGSVMQKTIRDGLIVTVENNIDEVEFFTDINEAENDNDADHYIAYGDGYLEVDDDYLDLVNGVSTALYLDSGAMLYGENPIARYTAEFTFSDSEIRRVSVDGVTYYVYDRGLSQEQLNGLWLRGIVSGQHGTEQLSSIVSISLCLLPLLLIISIAGGYFIADKSLKPIREIDNAASQISRGRDLKKRIELLPGNDELHKLADTFNDMFGRLDEAFESERRFTSDVSHELRTPMAVIMAQCEYALESAKTTGEYEAALLVIKRQGSKMTKMIDDMLRFVRLEQKSENYTKEPIDLSGLLTSICEDMALLREQNIALSFDIEDGIFVSGNRELFSRLITNLIGNAYRYGRENGFIEVKLYSSERKALLSVRDNGIGITEEQLGKIFDRFYRADNARSGNGTGLGLAITREIANFHGGTVKAESKLGEGSIFTFEIDKI